MIFQVVFFVIVFPSFFRGRSCSLSLNAAQLDPSIGGRNRWQSCLIRNIKRESGDRWAERWRHTERASLKTTGCNWKTAKVGPARFLLYDAGFLCCAAALHGLLPVWLAVAGQGMVHLCVVSKMSRCPMQHTSTAGFELSFTTVFNCRLALLCCGFGLCSELVLLQSFYTSERT